MLAPDEELVEFLQAEHGDTGVDYFVLSAAWWDSWAGYVGFEDAKRDSPSSSSEHTPKERPGPIANEALEGPTPGSLKKSLVCDVHFRLVPRNSYELLQRWYGGGPHFVRQLNRSGSASVSGRPELMVELYPEVYDELGELDELETETETETETEGEASAGESQNKHQHEMLALFFNAWKAVTATRQVKRPSHFMVFEERAGEFSKMLTRETDRLMKSVCFEAWVKAVPMLKKENSRIRFRHNKRMLELFEQLNSAKSRTSLDKSSPRSGTFFARRNSAETPRKSRRSSPSPRMKAKKKVLKPPKEAENPATTAKDSATQASESVEPMVPETNEANSPPKQRDHRRRKRKLRKRRKEPFPLRVRGFRDADVPREEELDVKTYAETLREKMEVYRTWSRSSGSAQPYTFASRSRCNTSLGSAGTPGFDKVKLPDIKRELSQRSANEAPSMHPFLRYRKFWWRTYSPVRNPEKHGLRTSKYLDELRHDFEDAAVLREDVYGDEHDFQDELSNQNSMKDLCYVDDFESEVESEVQGQLSVLERLPPMPNAMQVLLSPEAPEAPTDPS